MLPVARACGRSLVRTPWLAGACLREPLVHAEGMLAVRGDAVLACSVSHVWVGMVWVIDVRYAVP